MSASDTPYAASGISVSARPARWPGVVGVIGMCIGALMTYSKIMDLARFLTWTEADWERILSPAQLELITATLPSANWNIGTAIFEIVLGVCLIVGSFWLLFRDARSVRVLKPWAWVMIAYGISISVWVAWWLGENWARIPGTEGAPVGAAYFGVAVAMALLLAFPVFLAVWLARADVKAEYETWSVGTS